MASCPIPVITGPHIESSEFVNVCPICRTDISHFSYCPTCGLPKHISSTKDGKLSNTYRSSINAVSGNFKSCYKCGCPNEKEAKYCRVCGTIINTHALDNKFHEWVDLGLSVLWAGENLQGLFRWMDILEIRRSTKMFGIPNEWEKVDTASTKWGYGWRIPTKEEFQELIDKCKWEKVFFSGKVKYNEQCNYRIIGPNGNSILLPITRVHKRRFNNIFDLNVNTYKDYLITNLWGGLYWTQSQCEEDFTSSGFFFTSKLLLIYDTLFKLSNQIPKDLYDKFIEYYNCTRSTSEPFSFNCFSYENSMDKNIHGLYPFEWLMEALKIRDVVAYEKIMETMWMSLDTEKTICSQLKSCIANVRPVKDK